jgi:DNA gyrase subunit A
MPLRRLTGLERQNLQREFEQLNEAIQLLRQLLSDRRELLKALKKDLRSLKRKYDDPRRTRLAKESGGAKEQRSQGAEEQNNPKSQIPNPKSEEAVVEFTQRGYVRRSAISPSRSARKPKAEIPDNDLIIQTDIAQTKQDLVVLTSGGKVYPIQVADIPPATRASSRGTPLVSLLPSAAGRTEALVSHFFLPEDPETVQLVMLTQLGRIKRLSLSELVNLTNRGLTVMKFKDDDQLLFTHFTQTGQDVVLATIGGRLLRFQVDDEQLPVMGRTAVGLQALRLRKQEQLVGCVTLGKLDDNLLLVSQLGYVKRMPVSKLRRANRGDIGTQALYFTSKSDALTAMVLAPAAGEVALVTNTQRVVRLPVDSVTLLGKDGTGERIPSLKPDEKIITVTSLASTSN